MYIYIYSTFIYIYITSMYIYIYITLYIYIYNIYIYIYVYNIYIYIYIYFYVIYIYNIFVIYIYTYMYVDVPMDQIAVPCQCWDPLCPRTGKGLVSFTMGAADSDLPQLEGLGAKNWPLVSSAKPYRKPPEMGFLNGILWEFYGNLWGFIVM